MGFLQFILDLFAEKDIKFYNSGQKWMAKGDFLRASYEFKEAIKLKPTEGKYHDIFGKSLYKRGMISEAEHSFSVADDLKSLEADPRNVSTLCRLARAFQERRMFVLAQGYIKRAMILNPESDQVHFLLGRANFLSNKHNESIQEFDKAITLNPYCVDAYQALQDIYRVMGRKAKSKEYADIATQIAKMEKSPMDANIHVELANTFHKYKKDALAEKEYHEALKRDENCGGAVVGIGILQYEGGNRSAAIKSFLSAIKINKYQPLPHGYLGLIYKEDSKTQKAAKWETELAKQLTLIENAREPTKICEAYMRLGDFFLSRKKMEEATDAYLRMVRFDRNNPIAYVKLAIVSIYAKKDKHALRYCDHAIMLEPEEEVGYVGKGRVLMEMGDHEKAITCFQEGLKYAQNSPEIHGWLAVAYKKKGLLKLAEREEQIVDAIEASADTDAI